MMTTKNRCVLLINRINVNSKRKKYYCLNNEENIPTDEYKSRLRNEFIKIHGNSDWANFDDKNEETDFLRDFHDLDDNPKDFTPDTLSFHRCIDANRKHCGKGRVASLQFHPRSRIFLVGSVENSLRLFGYNQEEEFSFISSIQTHKLRVRQARFVGTDSIVGSALSSTFFHYDLHAEKLFLVPPAKVISGTLGEFCASPDSRLLAFHSSTRGQMHLIDHKSKEFIRTLTRNGCIMSSHFLGEDKILLHGDDGTVWVFDVRSFKCVHKFADQGCLEGTTLSVSPNLEYIACGSNTGVVNLYSSSDCLNNSGPNPLHVFKNLVTGCTHSVFDPSSSVLGFSSCDKPNAVKLVWGCLSLGACWGSVSVQQFPHERFGIFHNL